MRCAIKGGAARRGGNGKAGARGACGAALGGGGAGSSMAGTAEAGDSASISGAGAMGGGGETELLRGNGWWLALIRTAAGSSSGCQGGALAGSAGDGA